MRRGIRNYYSGLILWLISVSILSQIDRDNMNGVSMDKDHFVCKQKVLWRLRMCSKGNVVCSKNEKYVEKAKHYIKAFSSFNRRRIEIAARKFRKIAPYIMPYIRTIYKVLKNLQQQLELLVYSSSIDKKINIKIMCSDGEKRFLWYGIILKRDNYGLILVGDNGNVIDSIPINANDIWGISNYSCDLKNSKIRYAIEIKIGSNPSLLRRGSDMRYNFIATEDEYYNDSEIVSHFSRNSYGIVKRNKINRKYKVIVSDKESKEYYGLRNFIFSLNGQRYGFIAHKGNKETAVIDGEETKEYDEIANLVFSTDGQRYGFIAKKGNKWVVVIDGKENRREYDRIASLVFSSNSQKYGFVAKKGNKQIAVINGRKSKRYDEVKYLVFSPNGRKYGFAAKRGNKQIAVINGKESKEYNYVWHIIFSRDSKRYGFVAKKENKWIVVIDGKESKEYDWILHLGFSPDGGRYGFVAKKKNNKQVAVIDGEESEEYDKILYDAIIWDKNGKLYIYVGKKEDKHDIVVNGDIFRSLSNKPDLYTYKDGVGFIEYRNNKIYNITCKSR